MVRSSSWKRDSTTRGWSIAWSGTSLAIQCTALAGPCHGIRIVCINILRRSGGGWKPGRMVLCPEIHKEELLPEALLRRQRTHEPERELVDDECHVELHHVASRVALSLGQCDYRPEGAQCAQHRTNSMQTYPVCPLARSPCLLQTLRLTPILVSFPAVLAARDDPRLDRKCCRTSRTGTFSGQKLATFSISGCMAASSLGSLRIAAINASQVVMLASCEFVNSSVESKFNHVNIVISWLSLLSQLFYRSKLALHVRICRAQQDCYWTQMCYQTRELHWSMVSSAWWGLLNAGCGASSFFQQMQLEEVVSLIDSLFHWRWGLSSLSCLPGFTDGQFAVAGG